MDDVAEMLQDAGETVLEVAEDAMELVAPTRRHRGLLLLLILAIVVAVVVWKRKQDDTD